jgi:signal transduction histidine kinase
MRMQLSSALRSGEGEREQALRDAVAQLGTEVDKLRALITELRPAALDQIGLAPAIEALTLHAEKTQGLDVEADIDLRFDADGAAERLDPELENTVYRVVQEALTNAAKHSRAEHVRLRVAAVGAMIEVEVTDDGVGFDPEEAGPGFGLVGMRERVELAGGRIEISSSPGSGTTLAAAIPAGGEAEPRRGAA